MITARHIKGFTLIELLVVITIISTLLVVVFVALNPGGRLQQARDARRSS
ncbi:MAG: prepilin-type N-terminal cleavage/methylation domain-containing protein, partial [Patescibacteria group bacterium]|nr:prepilin-type N-terminal cleavage/methylation domain-containing protein [Patescibacteria group bacterium]